MKSFIKRQLPVIIVFLVGILLLAQFYIPHPLSQGFLEESNRWVRIIKNCALLLGVVSLLVHHGRKVKRGEAGYGYSLLVFLAFLPMVFFGLWKGIDAPSSETVSAQIDPGTFETMGLTPPVNVQPGDQITIRPATPGEELPEGLHAGVRSGPLSESMDLFPIARTLTASEAGQLELHYTGEGERPTVDVEINIRSSVSPAYWLFQNVKVPMESTMISLLAFFISSAAFRAFRARSIDAGIMLAAALIVMIGRVSFGDIISSWAAGLVGSDFLFFPEATYWLLSVPATAAKRAILLGIALSIAATSTRIIFGIERSYLGRTD